MWHCASLSHFPKLCFRWWTTRRGEEWQGPIQCWRVWPPSKVFNLYIVAALYIYEYNFFSVSTVHPYIYVYIFSINECYFVLNYSLEHILPDNLFASPAVAGDHINVFSTASAPFNESTSAISSSSNSNSHSNSNNLLPTASTSTSNATSPKSVLSSSGTAYFFPCMTSKIHAQ